MMMMMHAGSLGNWNVPIRSLPAAGAPWLQLPWPSLAPCLDASCAADVGQRHIELIRWSLLHGNRTLKDCPPAPKSNMPIIIGAGPGGTGTRSVAWALRELGFKVCHATPLTTAALVDSVASQDITHEFERADAWFDEPMRHLWLAIACAFPDYKVILTVRADIDQHEGGEDCKNSHQLWTYPLMFCLNDGTACPRGSGQRNSYHSVVANVLATVPPERLLVMNMSLGKKVGGFEWTRLAQFLGRPVPNMSFPRSNHFFCDRRPPAAPHR